MSRERCRFDRSVEIPGEHVVETIRHSVTGPTLSPDVSDALAQTGGGDIGGMFFAVLLLVGLGLAVVALWHGGLSGLLGQFGRDSRESRSIERAQDGAAESTATPAETQAAVEPGSGQDLESPESAEKERSDRDVVLGILDENDGRMKQARIVDATDWSKSKVSMVLSEMEEDGDITKLRVGRENIISLEGSEPEAAGSPFDDE